LPKQINENKKTPLIDREREKGREEMVKEVLFALNCPTVGFTHT
jgi:hypothetical protein